MNDKQQAYYFKTTKEKHIHLIFEVSKKKQQQRHNNSNTRTQESKKSITQQYSK